MILNGIFPKHVYCTTTTVNFLVLCLSVYIFKCSKSLMSHRRVATQPWCPLSLFWLWLGSRRSLRIMWVHCWMEICIDVKLSRTCCDKCIVFEMLLKFWINNAYDMSHVVFSQKRHKADNTVNKKKTTGWVLQSYLCNRVKNELGHELNAFAVIVLTYICQISVFTCS